MESLLLLALFLLLPLVEQLVKFVRRHADREIAPASPGPHPAPAAVALPARVEPGATPHRVRPSPRPDPPVSMSRPVTPARPVQATGRPRRGARRVLRSTTGLRRAVVLMTILGPCRALEPDAFQQPSR